MINNYDNNYDFTCLFWYCNALDLMINSSWYYTTMWECYMVTAVSSNTSTAYCSADWDVTPPNPFPIRKPEEWIRRFKRLRVASEKNEECRSISLTKRMIFSKLTPKRKIILLSEESLKVFCQTQKCYFTLRNQEDGETVAAFHNDLLYFGGTLWVCSIIRSNDQRLISRRIVSCPSLTQGWHWIQPLLL